MSDRLPRPARLAGLLTTLIGASSLIAAAGTCRAEDKATSAKVPQSGGMTIYIDPKTGQTTKTPADGTVPLALSQQELERMSTSHQGLVEVPGTAPGGGIKVDLQGRFQSPLVATVGPDGKVRMHHLQQPADTDVKK